MAELDNVFDDENEAIATAPGDIPLPMVRERIAAQAHQFRHDNTIRPFAPQAQEAVEIWATSGVAMPLDRAEVWFTTDGRLPDATSRHWDFYPVIQEEGGGGARCHSIAAPQNGGWQRGCPPP